MSPTAGAVATSPSDGREREPARGGDVEPRAAIDRVERRERRAMGSPLRLQVAGPVRAADAAWAAVSDEFERAEDAMSRFRPQSELTAVNRAAGLAASRPVSRRLYAALAAADRAWRVTGGRFDPRVLRDLERLGYAGAPLPARDGQVAAPPPGLEPAGPEVARAGAATPWLERDPRRRTVRLAVPVDLGGIGKGLALRWAWRRLERSLPEGASALLEAGGDLVFGGTPPQGGPWMVAIEQPPLGDAPAPDTGPTPPPAAVVALASGAVCTSSIQVHRWRDAAGRSVHHLIDPLTGEPGGDGLLSVTVAGSDPAWAEVWSKTLFLAGRRGVAALARSRGLAAWWIAADGSLEMTPAARQVTAWTAD